MCELKASICENGIAYELNGEVYLPQIELPKATQPIGHWGRMHREYLKEHHPLVYNHLLINGTLYTYLADIDTQARLRLERIVQQMQEKESISESLKESNPIAWVQRMNGIRAQAEEILIHELICDLENDRISL